jgi:hypothetical protein
VALLRESNSPKASWDTAAQFERGVRATAAARLHDGLEPSLSGHILDLYYITRNVDIIPKPIFLRQEWHL